MFTTVHYRPVDLEDLIGTVVSLATWISAISATPLRRLGVAGSYIDAVGQPVFLVVLLIALIVGAGFGAVGAAANAVTAWDEFVLWVIGGTVGGVLTVVCWDGILWSLCALCGLDASVTLIAIVGLFLFSIAALFGTVVAPLLDDIDSAVAWLFSFLIKWMQSPLLTTASLVATMIVMLRGGKVDFRRGMLFIAVGSGRSALTLGAVGWTQSGCFRADGAVPDNLARHESVHSRTVAATGELGFYLTYITLGATWGLAQGGSWNNLNAAGCGNPFEKSAHTFTNDPATPRSASHCQ
ncbi:MAG TPA: hypothetical protein VFA63_08780 [Pseudonocardiaceae bacterium]|nr:hypothetical protein [Pseudonocardiaceae bacterium]